MDENTMSRSPSPLIPRSPRTPRTPLAAAPGTPEPDGTYTPRVAASSPQMSPPQWSPSRSPSPEPLQLPAHPDVTIAPVPHMADELQVVHQDLNELQEAGDFGPNDREDHQHLQHLFGQQPIPGPGQVPELVGGSQQRQARQAQMRQQRSGQQRPLLPRPPQGQPAQAQGQQAQVPSPSPPQGQQ